ncbi:MAG: hypothetical protein CMH27_06250 [Micavibrio sp.]|nr:hypothetical protein [Micavibrio sp.]
MPKRTDNKISDHPDYRMAKEYLQVEFNRLAEGFKNCAHITLGMKIYQPEAEPEKAALYINATVNGEQRPNDLYIIFNSHGDGTDAYPAGAAFIKKRFEMHNNAQGACPIPETVAINDFHAYDRTFEAYKNFLNNLE